MKRILFLLLLVFVAASYTDQLDADFNASLVQTDVNVTNNTVILNGTAGNYSLTGVLESQVFDFGSNPENTTISWTFQAPTGTSVLVTSRSGPTSTPDGNWGSFSQTYTNSTSSTITSAQNRYYQYRINLTTTNASVTPEVSIVTLVFFSAGPDVVAATGLNTNLNEDTAGSYRFYVNITDTVALSGNTSARYRIGNDTYTNYTNLTNSTTETDAFYIDIPAPSGNWSTRNEELLSINVFVSNAHGNTTNITFAETIDDVNHGPTLAILPNITGVESVQLTFNIIGSDVDGDNLTYTSTVGTVSTVNNTATVTWTPQDPFTGIVNVTVTVSDGSIIQGGWFIANISTTNDAPTMRVLTDQTGYFGDRISFAVIVDDVDTAETHIFWSVPPLFDVVSDNLTGVTVYTALVNFTALTDHEGENLVSVYVTDGEFTDHQNMTLTIGYCGDDICQSNNESTDTCAEDCSPLLTPNYIAFELPDRLCTNETINFTVYNASSRFICGYEKRAFESAAFCEVLDAAEIKVYSVVESLHTEVSVLTSGTEGEVSYTPSQAGTYKLVSTKEGYVSASAILTVNDCLDPIDVENIIINASRPQLTLDDVVEEEITPQIEQPAIVEEEATLLSIIIWYMLIPLLLAGFVYTGSLFYQIHKDTNPILLDIRIRTVLLLERLEPVFAPIQKAFAPVGAALEKAFGPVLRIFDRFLKR